MKYLGALFIAILLLPAIVFATDFTSSNFMVKDPVINELGGYSTSTNFQLWGNIPYIEPIYSTSASFGNLPEFLGFTSTTPTTTPATSSSGGGGGGGGGGPPPGEEPLPKPPRPKPPQELLKLMDCNSDGRINLVDLSCLLYYADKTGPIIEPHDFNSDGKIDLVDVSILLYYWYDPA